MRSPRAATLPLPIPRALANPTAAHTHGHAPHRWSCPRTPSVAPATLLDPYLSRVPCRDAAPIHRALGRPLRPVPCPAAATTAGSSSQLPGPSPTSPHARGSQLHVTTGAAEGQSRLGGRGLGAGRARSPRCSPAQAQGQSPRLRRHGSHQLLFGHRQELQFPNPLPLQKMLAPGPPCGQAVVTASGPLLTGFLKTRSQRELDRAPTVLILASSLGLCPGCFSLGLQHSTTATERIWMENEWPATVNSAKPSVPTTKIRSCLSSKDAG